MINFKSIHLVHVPRKELCSVWQECPVMDQENLVLLGNRFTLLRIIFYINKHVILKKLSQSPNTPDNGQQHDTLGRDHLYLILLETVWDYMCICLYWLINIHVLSVNKVAEANDICTKYSYEESHRGYKCLPQNNVNLCAFNHTSLLNDRVCWLGPIICVLFYLPDSYV